MMARVLDEVLAIFGCDRAYLLYPCNPEATTWSIPMERTRPDFPGAGSSKRPIAMDRDIATKLRLLRAHEGALRFGAKTDLPLPKKIVQRFNIRSMMAVALYPKTGEPWEFGIQQCSSDRVWSDEEELLLEEIGRRITNALTHLSMFRALQDALAVVENSPTVLFRWKNEEGWPVAYVSANVERQFGYTPEELTSRRIPFGSLVHPDDLARVEGDVEAHLAAGDHHYTQEYRIKTADGSIRWLEDHTTVRRDSSGKILYFEGVVTDQTERKRAEQAQADHIAFVESLDRIDRAIQGQHTLNAMLSAVLDEVLAIFDCDRTFLVYPINPEATTWRVPVERFKPQYPGASTGRGDMPMTPEIAAMHRASLACDHPLPFGAGTDLPIQQESDTTVGDRSGLLMVLHPKNDQPWGFALIQCSYDRSWSPSESRLFEEVGRRMSDALTTLLALRDLSASDARYRRIVDTASEGILMMDAAHHITFVNNRMSAMVGYSRDELLGHPAQDFVLEQAQPGFEQHMAARRQGMAEHHELRLRHKGGGELWVLISATPILDEAGGGVGSFAMLTDITKRKEAEQALRESEHNLLAAQHIGHIGNWWHNLVTGELYWSEEFFNILGIKPQKPSPELALPLIHPDDITLLTNDMAISANREGQFEQEFRVIRPDGDIRWVHNRWIQIHDENGHEIKRVGTHQDITERKQAEGELKRLNREIKAISACNLALMRAEEEVALLKDVCTIICAQAGYLLAWVGYAEQDEGKSIRPVAWAGEGSDYIAQAHLSWSADLPHGQGPAGMLIRSGQSIYVEDFESDQHMAPWRQAALDHGYHSGMALPLKDETGHTFAALLIYSGEKGQITEGEVLLMEEMAGDLAYGIRALRSRAENRRAEEALLLRERYAQSLLRMSRQLEQAQSYRQVVEAAREEVVALLGYHYLAVYLLSDDQTTFKVLASGGTMVEAIDQFSATLPIAGDPMLEEIAQSQGIVVVADARTDPRTNKEIVTTMNLLTIVNVPIFLSERHLGTISTGTVGNEGIHDPSPAEQEYLIAMASHVAVTLDRLQLLAERKQAEESLRRYKNHLEETVQQRTAELLLARDAAQTANKAKSLFLANMSHELRTPLNAILGFSHLMHQDRGLTDRQEDNLDIINRSGEHLLSLINDVLEIAKIESGKLQLDIAPFDLGRMVHEVLELMRLRAEQKGLTLELDQSSQFPRFISGDEARLRQVLVNLVGNAVKFTHKGGVIVRLGVRHNTQQHLLIAVEDTGPGITPEQQNHLFEPFVQLNAGIAQGGSGLGLSITQQYVELMGGEIEVSSAAGKGATFQINLPLELPETDDIDLLSSQEHGEVIGLAPGTPPYRILIAEDQPENRTLLLHLMNNIGLETETVENGAQCMARFEQWHPDLLWMDRLMPIMDGEEATRRIRGLPGGQRVKIVAVTASVFREQQPEILAAGMDDLVRKPYLFNEIYDCLAQQLGIEYLYRNESERRPPPLEPLTPAMLAATPAAERARLHEALESLDTRLILEALAPIVATNPTLGSTLSRLVESFDYPAILNALDRVEGSPRTNNTPESPP